MNFEGKVYRPWIEANSVLIQVTLGCSMNHCTFCNMFRDKRFKFVISTMCSLISRKPVVTIHMLNPFFCAMVT